MHINHTRARFVSLLFHPNHNLTSHRSDNSAPISLRLNLFKIHLDRKPNERGRGSMSARLRSSQPLLRQIRTLAQQVPATHPSPARLLPETGVETFMRPIQYPSCQLMRISSSPFTRRVHRAAFLASFTRSSTLQMSLFMFLMPGILLEQSATL